MRLIRLAEDLCTVHPEVRKLLREWLKVWRVAPVEAVDLVFQMEAGLCEELIRRGEIEHPIAP